MTEPNRVPIAVLCMVISLGATACTEGTGQERPSQTNQEPREAAYDSTLAAELGADDYGMRRYVMALLRAGPNRDQDSTQARELQRAHMENIRRLAEEGQLIMAGPFLDDGALRGLYVFDVESVEEARDLTATDPAIEAGRLEMELHPWYGPAALQQVNEIQGSITKDVP